MTRRNLLFVLATVISGSGCFLWNPSAPSVPVEDDKSIVFPQFFESRPVQVGEDGTPFELDGELLRAVTIAANDFLPPGSKERPCGSRQEAQRYRVIRQGNIFFIYIYEDPTYCGRKYLALDSGAKYAISTDGRILRRVLDGEPEAPNKWVDADGGPQGVLARPGVMPGFEPIEDGSVRPSSEDGGSPGTTDGG